VTTAVLLCADGAPAPNGWTPRGAHVVPFLCARPERIRDLAAGADRLVLGLCGGRFSLGPVQREARKAGFDPLGVEIVDLDAAAGDERRLATLVAGAVARAAAFAGSEPEHAKLVFPAQTSRRALLTFAMPEYVAAPGIDHGRCAAERGCRACVDVCPTGALTLVNGRVLADRSVCEPCGRCVTACPTGATENPAATATQVEAQVRALLDPAAGSPGPRGIVFRCRRATRTETAANWYPVTVPCTAMVTAGWLLAPLVMGAGGVAVRPCSDSGCPLRQDEALMDRVPWCKAYLAAVELPTDLVGIDPDAMALRDPLPAAAVRDPFGPVGTAGVLAALAELTGNTEGELNRRGSPVGVADVDPGACTGCGTCAATCPTGALVASDGDGRRTLSFDANLCVACGSCARRCPEAGQGAITVRLAVDVGRLRAGRLVASTSDLVACRSCGRTVAPSKLLARIGALIDDERLAESLTTRCQDCRGLPFAVGT
jgi:ferredoxin